MRRLCRSFALAIPALAFALAGCGGEPEGVDGAPAAPAPPGEATFSPDEPTELWFVELGEPARVRGGDPALQADERVRFERAAVDVGLRYRKRLSFERLWNGLSVQVAAGGDGALAAMPGVRAIWPVVEVLPDLVTATAMTGADIVRTQIGVTGEKVLVGVIDGGIDYHHPDLGGCFGDGCRVAFGTDFVGDDYDATVPITSIPVPDDDPDDCGGHGTHVAGIIGAKGVVTGVAPDVIFGAYKIFGCSGTTSTDMLVQAMERAAADGMRVINMSIGSPFQWPEYPSAAAADALLDAGVVVVTSAGNSGARGLWAVGSPGTGDRVIAAASIENTHGSRVSFTISPDDLRFGYQSSSGTPIAPLSGSAPLVRTGTITSTTDACDPLPAGSLTGAVALIRRSGCPFNQKAANAQAAGAAGVVFYNHVETPIYPILDNGVPITIPAVIVPQVDGETINTRLDVGPVTMTWTDDIASVPNPLAYQIASTSSYGLTAPLTLKPDIAAPGGAILSTIPLEKGGWNVVGGTSMASPHVAGAVALLIDARPEVPFTKVRDLLQNTAAPVTWSGDLAAGVPDNTYRQGAGMVRIDRALASPVVISPGTLALGESQAGPHTVTLTLRSLGAVAVTYQLSHVAGVSTPAGDHYAPQHVIGGAASVQLGAASVTVPAGGEATVQATITADAALADGSLYGGWIVLTPDGGTAADALRVPYAGFKGDYQAVPVLTQADQGYPWIGRRTGVVYVKQSNGAVFTLQAGDTPYVVAHVDHGARRILLDVFEATTMKPWGRMREVTYQPQNSTATETFKYQWNGTTTLNKSTVLVPNGDYVIQMRVLRALGDENDPAHWETWTSSVIRINHP